MGKELTIVYESDVWKDYLVKLIEDADPDSNFIRMRCFFVKEWDKHQTLDHEMPYEKILFIGNEMGKRLKVARDVYDKCGIKISISGNQAAIYRYSNKLSVSDIDLLIKNGEIDEQMSRILKHTYEIFGPKIGLSLIRSRVLGIADVVKGIFVESKLINAVYRLAINKFFKQKLGDFMDLNSDEWNNRIKMSNEAKYKPID